ncbi:MAG: hypothetical protein P1Q69_07375, partial [Candidatus Thorarchaeota archaeon]|nr:hypothetical protein [Candidatus Thorarchaeota archaeon]
IAMSKLVGKRMLVVTPTNRIGLKTIPNAVKIAKEILQVDIHGAMLAMNRKACLRLVFLDQYLHWEKKENPSWGDEGIAYTKIHYHNKPECQKCRFNQAEIDIYRKDTTGVPLPVLEAEPDYWNPVDGSAAQSGSCAYITLRNHLDELDIVFTTYSKMMAIMMNETEEAQEIRKMLLENFDVILLDEISHLAAHSPLTVPLFQRSARTDKTNKQGYRMNLLDILRDDICFLEEYSTSNITMETIEMIRSFIKHYEDLERIPLRENKTYDVQNSILSLHQQDIINEKFSAIHGIIEDITVKYNEHKWATEDIMHIIRSDTWTISSIPTQFNPVDIKLILKPEVSLFRRFVRQFARHPDKQLLVTDATLPFVDLREFLKVDLHDNVVGDPRGTNQTQLIITDARDINVVELMFSDRATELQKDLLEFINMICVAHDPEDVILVTPNKTVYHLLHRRMQANEIPRFEMTWYRSDKTVGVECDKRIMICVGAPYPPKGSYNWLASWYHEQGLLRHYTVDNLGDELAASNGRASFYQTIGRTKDPTCSVRSVVYLWGINNTTLYDLLNFKNGIPLPHIVIPTREASRNQMVIEFGKTWREKKILVPLDEVQILSKVFKYGEFDSRDTRRLLKGYARTSIEQKIIDMNADMLDAFGITRAQFMLKNRIYWRLLKKRDTNAIPSGISIQQGYR